MSQSWLLVFLTASESSAEPWPQCECGTLRQDRVRVTEALFCPGSPTHVSLLLASVSLGKGYFHLVMRPTSPDMKVR